MKYISHITDHAEKANNYLLQQYKDRPNIKALLDSIIEPMQKIEDKVYELYIQYYLPVATSYHLDRLGAIIGVNRQGRGDGSYRYAINLGIISNNSGGTPEEIISILKSIYPVDKIEFLESGTAYFQIYVQGLENPHNINKLLLELKPAGVNSPSVIYSDDSNVFRFSERVTGTAASSVRTTNEEAELEVNYSELSLADYELSYDSYEPLEKSYGYAEIIVNKPALELYDDSIYTVNSQDELEMLLDFGDYTIQGGSKLAEDLRN